MSTISSGRMTRRQALRGPAWVGLAGVAGAALLYFRDPHIKGSYGFCPFNALTGLYCPGCGGTRAANDLTNLDFGAALSSNALAVGLAAMLAFAFIVWVSNRWRGRDARMIAWSVRSGGLAVAVMIIFTIVRNTPWGAGLAP